MLRVRVVAGVVPIAALLWLASSAPAAFPGANGLLAVQPRTGGGIVLVSASGRGERRICVDRAVCGVPRRPRWSEDGRELVFAGPAIRIIYPDGSCLNCQFGVAPNPAFEPGGTVISFVTGGRVALDKIDGIRDGSGVAGGASDAVWSAAGALAVVRGGVIWAGRPGSLMRVGAGSEPTWAPGGARIAAARDGWVVIIRVGDRREVRLVRGSAPAFSPDGRWIAYIAPDHRLMVVRASGGLAKPRRVGNIRAVSVDWQPKPRRSPPACSPPPGSVVIGRSATAVVTGDGLPQQWGFSISPPIAYMGCLLADGRERLLERFTGNNVDGATVIDSVLLSGPYAGLIRFSIDEHYGGQQSTLQVFDLRTGRLEPRLGGENAGCADYNDGGPCGLLDDVVLSSDGVSAAHTQIVYPAGSLSNALTQISCAPASSTCVTIDGAFGHVFGSTDPSGGRQAWTEESFLQVEGLAAISCPSSTLCLGLTGNSIYTTNNPAVGTSGWTSTPLPDTDSYVNDVSCPSVNLCVATDGDGSVLTSTNPTGTWSAAKIDGDRSINSIFCSTQPVCFVVDSAGTVLSSTDPTGGASAWSASASTPPFDSGACPTTSFCVAVDGSEIETTNDPSAATWTPQPQTGTFYAVACPSASLCLAVGAGGALGVSTNPGSGPWAPSTIDDGRNLDSISCASPSLCVAVDSAGHVVSSTDPTGGPSTWTSALLDGDPCDDTTPCSVEQIQASDANGLHTVDTSRIPGSGPFLTGLTLTGDVLSWNHDGTPRTITLTP